jgi:protein-tyrosine phosphatase
MTAPQPERHLPFESALNVRDIGGYAGAEGRLVRWRTVLRAGDLSRLSAADRAAVRDIGVKTVIDLRHVSEVERGRFPVEDIPVRYEHLPLVSVLANRDLYRTVPGFAAVRYRQIAAEGATGIATALTILAAPGTRPAIVHCTAGKDRTGILIGLLLSLLGVDDDTVAEDYALSTIAMERLRARRAAADPARAVDPDVDRALLASEPATMRGLLEALRDEHGSIEGYLEAGGMAPGVSEALRESLLQ